MGKSIMYTKFCVLVTNISIPPFYAGFVTSYVKIEIIDNNGEKDIFYKVYTSDCIPEISKKYNFIYRVNDISGWVGDGNALVRNAKIVTRFETFR
jgi:hypothetical protein